MKPSRKLNAAAMPETTDLMLCSSVAEAFDGPDWIFETKIDGLRVLCHFDGEEVYFYSRNGKRQDAAFPEIVRDLKSRLRKPALLDGEIACLDAKGVSSFKALQQRLHIEDPATVRRRALEHPAELFLFDCIYADRFDLTRLTLTERKAHLKEIVRFGGRIRWTPFTEAKGRQAFARACRNGEEGVVAKRRTSPYVGRRSGDWLKIKCTQRQEFVIAGYTDPKGSRESIGALLLGYYSDDGSGLRYAGKVGTGFDRETLRDLKRKLNGLDLKRSPFSGPSLSGSDVHWVKPKLVAEIAYGDWTQHEMLRHPRFEGLRDDKDAREVRRERASPSRATNVRSLDRYRAMRDFGKTAEPAGEARTSASGSMEHAGIFVIQKHAATRLHWDFRLEAEGVLKSWAVTNEPSLDPAIKRLAVEVEDHPVEYAKFAGRIPKGEYGAGKVEIWDHGTYEIAGPLEAQKKAGKIKFRLLGKRLQGEFALVRMRPRGSASASKPQWLLIKVRESAKTPSKLAATGAHRTQFTHLDRVVFPERRITKGEVVEYYRSVARHLLPYLRGRPLTLERLPEGLTGPYAPRFWQKNTPAYYPSWIERADLPTVTGKPVRYAVVNDLDSLLYMVNQGALSFHIWTSRTSDLDHPDFVLFDLDPGELAFPKLVRIALELHKILDAMKIPNSVKTSGKSGLHILTPWSAKQGDHDRARAWATEIATELVRRLPKLATLERSIARRGKRAYIDIMQNAKGHHFVPPYVLRAVPGATVSMPLRWEELKPSLRPAQFDIRNALERLRKMEPVLL